MDAGLFDTILIAINFAIASGLVLMYPWMLLAAGLAGVLGTWAILRMTMTWMWVGKLLMLCLFYLKVIVVVHVLQNFQTIADALINAAAGAGLAFAGQQITVVQFLSPGLLFQQSARLTAPLIIWLDNVGYAAALKPHIYFAMTFLSFLIVLLWIVMAANLLMIIVLFKILTPIAAMGVGFLLSPYTRWVGTNLIKGLLAEGVRVFVLAVMTSAIFILAPHLTLPNGASPTLWSAFALAGASFVLLLFAVAAPMIGAKALGASAIPGYALASQIVSVGMMMRGVSSLAAHSVPPTFSGGQAALPPSSAVQQTAALQRAARNLVAARRGSYE
jgi:type IV secretory pathway TrbL component